MAADRPGAQRFHVRARARVMKACLHALALRAQDRRLAVRAAASAARAGREAIELTRVFSSGGGEREAEQRGLV